MNRKKLALIASKGTLDWAYPPFILASTAAALDYEVRIFFTFYGLLLLRHDISSLKISPLANPAMPMPVPMPVFVQGMPGMETMVTAMMKSRMRMRGIASLADLRSACIEADVGFIGCQMTVDLFGFSTEDFISQTQFGGAATFLEFAGDADVSLFI
jgi:peroxiredoxin family protein